nr:hypothetical protein [uncultured Marvinbryantia sp.]
MKRVAEMIYIVPEKRDEYLRKWLNPSLKTQQILWIHGIRNQYYFKLNEFIMMTFEYVGTKFQEDMNAIAKYPEIDALLVKKRRKEVPGEERDTTNWWAPVKRLGSILTESPMPEDRDEELSLTEQYHEMLSGRMGTESSGYDISYDEDDWSESIHI